MGSTNSSFDFSKEDTNKFENKDSSNEINKEKIFNSTALINEYNSSADKKKYSSTSIFEKIKPIMKSWKNNFKSKKTETKEKSTSMDCDMTITTDFNKYDSLDPSFDTTTEKTHNTK